MTDLPSYLAKYQGPDGDPVKFGKQARAFVHAGGAILFPHQLATLTPQARAEIEKVMDKAYGKKRSGN